MTRRRLHLLLVLALAALVGLPPAGGAQEQASPGTVLRIATIAPRGSPWHRVFGAWSNTLRTATGGRVSIQVVSGRGTERSFVDEMRAGRLDGAVLTSMGIGLVARSALVLQAPGVVRDEAELDRARRGLHAELSVAFREGGTELLGWSDLGRGRIFSTRPIRTPDDLRTARIWQPEGEQTFAEFLQAANARGVPLALTDVLPGLQDGRVDTVVASASAVSALQWHTRLTHVTQQSSTMIVGATVLAAPRIDALSEADRAVLRETAARAHDSLQRSMRRDDERTLQALVARGMTSVDASAARTAWSGVEDRVRTRLVGRLYSRELLERAMAAARAR